MKFSDFQKKQVKKEFYSAGISKIAIERSGERVKVVIHTAKPGVVVGRKGVGIDKKHLKIIKDKFFRIAKHDWDNSLGLGLYIVEKILKLHNTHLEIESEIKKGSRFYFDISTLKEDKESQLP